MSWSSNVDLLIQTQESVFVKKVTGGWVIVDSSDNPVMVKKFISPEVANLRCKTLHLNLNQESKKAKA